MQKSEIDVSKLEKIQKLGKGTYGEVWQGKWDITTDVAIKMLVVDQEEENTYQEFFEEVKIMQELNHPNIVRCYGYCKKPPCLVMELMNQSLYTYLNNQENDIPWELRVKISLEIVSGLKCIHDTKILHRDLKSLNVLLDGTLKAKIIDFGLARVKLESKAYKSKTQVGTYRWMAPELAIEQPVYNYESDIYALGVIFWEVAARKVPFAQATDLGVIRLLLEKKREQIPLDCPPQFADIIQGCWKQNPKERLTIQQVQQQLVDFYKTFNKTPIPAPRPITASEQQVQVEMQSQLKRNLQEQINNPYEEVQTQVKQQVNNQLFEKQFQRISTFCINSDMQKTYVISSKTFEESTLD